MRLTGSTWKGRAWSGARRDNSSGSGSGDFTMESTSGKRRASVSLSSDRFGCDTQIRSFAGKYSFNEMGGDCSYSGVSEHDKIALLQEWMG